MQFKQSMKLLTLSLAIVLAYHGSGFASGINARGTVTVVEYNGCVDDLNAAIDGWTKCASDAEKALVKAKGDIARITAAADSENKHAFMSGFFVGGVSVGALLALLLILL